jgi:hypothetical protein
VSETSPSYPQPPRCPGHQGKILTLLCAQSCPGRHGAFHKNPFPTLLSDSPVCCSPGTGRSPPLRPQQLGSRTCLLWEEGACDPHSNKVCPTYRHQIARNAIPKWNNDQRNPQESLSKAKRKVLLLQKGAAADHCAIGRIQWVGSQLGFYLCPSTWWTGLGSQSSQLVT